MKTRLFFLPLLFALQSFSQSAIKMDSLSPSQIDIPIIIKLKPLFALAERNVDTVFTSPNYPEGWVEADCATRYKYRFRRSPLSMKMNGTTLNLSFMGYYQIVGSTRACVNGTVLSPWTPACRCGFSEPERKVTVGFNTSFSLLPNYILKTQIRREEPRALDKCEVCFWGQDITSTVIESIKSELDLSKKSMEDSFSTLNLRPQMQQAWNVLNQSYWIPNVGYFSLHPKNLRMQNINGRNDLLNIQIGISATPMITIEKPPPSAPAVPDLKSTTNKGGFNIYLEAALQYDSLSRVMNAYLVNKRFELSEGLIKKHIVVQNTAVSGNDKGDMVIRLDFTGSFNGTVYFAGKPTYNPATKSVEVEDLDYDLDTRNVLLKTAKWLFNKRISLELKKHTSFSLSNYYDTAGREINKWLNREWTKGIRGTGYVKDLKLTTVHALPEHLLLRSNCTGNLNVIVSDVDLKL